MKAARQASWPRISAVALIIANLVPLVGVLAWGWTAASVVIFYWGENLVIGFFTLIKMLQKGTSGLFLGLFFLLHYGGFCAGHGYLLVELLDLGDPALAQHDTWPFFLVFVQLLWEVIDYVASIAPAHWYFGLAALFFSHGISLIGNYFLGGEYHHTTANSLMAAPYRRIIVLHVTLLVGALALQAVGSPVVLVALLVVLKTALDLRTHLRSHRAETADTPALSSDRGPTPPNETAGP
jgi:hypothetical protein